MSKANTTYSNLIDKDFVFELAKRGKVSITSDQISIEVDQRGGDLDGLVLPPHTYLEYLYAKPGKYDNQETATLRFRCQNKEKA